MACLALTHVLALVTMLSLARFAYAFAAAPIPLSWTTLASCAVDNPERIIAGDITTQVANNTAAQCVASCATQGFGYAGVEFGNECHCGTGLVAPLEDAPATDCNTPCAGNSSFACGGVWRIQVRTHRPTSAPSVLPLTTTGPRRSTASPR